MVAEIYKKHVRENIGIEKAVKVYSEHYARQEGEDDSSFVERVIELDYGAAGEDVCFPFPENFDNLDSEFPDVIFIHIRGGMVTYAYKAGDRETPVPVVVRDYDVQGTPQSMGVKEDHQGDEFYWYDV